MTQDPELQKIQDELEAKISFHLAEKMDELKYKSRSSIVAWSLIDGIITPLLLSYAASEVKKARESYDIETLASLAHYWWAHWTKHLLGNMTEWNVERWKKQADTPYAELSEKEKESDREVARDYLQILSPKENPE